MALRHEFVGEGGERLRVIDGSPAARYFLQVHQNGVWRLVPARDASDLPLIGQLCREVVRLASPDDPSL